MVNLTDSERDEIRVLVDRRITGQDEGPSAISDLVGALRDRQFLDGPS